MFFILPFPLISLMGKSPLTLSLSPFSFLFLVIVAVGGMISSSPIGSSKIYFSPKWSSSLQPQKKGEGCLFEMVGVFGIKFPKFSLFL